MKKFILLLALILLGCATQGKYEQKLNSWIGRDKKDLILEWGVPDKTYRLDKSTELLSYNKKEFKQEGIKFWCKTTFTLVNEKVDKWKTQGNNCVSY